MTRDRAIEVCKKVAGTSIYDCEKTIDVLVALGVLKLDEPLARTMVDRERQFLVHMERGNMSPRELQRILSAAGLKIVEA